MRLGVLFSSVFSNVLRNVYTVAVVCLVLLAACSDPPEGSSGDRADTVTRFSPGDGVSFAGGDVVTKRVVDGTASSSADVGANIAGPCDFPATPANGQPGATCVEPSDCDSGFCVEGADGKICTRKCVECCPQGFACQEAKLGDAEFVCMPQLAALCRPCLDDASCANLNPGALCIPYGDAGAFCGGQCVAAKDCPVGYGCEDVKGLQGAGKQCVRKVGKCGCSPRSISDAAATYCSVSNAAGTCKGERKCTVNGLGQCDAKSAVSEVCNALDDDCDGTTDEDIDGAACQLVNAVGTCVGAMACEAGKEVCKGQEATQEQCNGQDDDCDGKTDEGFPDSDKDGKADCLDHDKDGDTYPDVKDCAPNDPKINPGATEVCNGKDDNCDGVTDESGAKGCKNFYADVDGDTYGNPQKSACLCAKDAVYTVADNNDCNDSNKLVSPGSTEICNGIDNNCDGKTDEGFQLGGSCKAGQGKCAVVGKMVCAATGLTTTCSAKAALASAEVCDGIDNNCNGQTDEGFQLGVACSKGKGACTAVGIWQCGNGKQAVCSAQIKTGSTEVCDGIDNDCDGKTDEGCDDDKDGYCDKGMTVLNNAACSKGQGDCDDSRNDVYPGHVELCDKRDNDCNGTVDSFSKNCSNACGTGSKTCNFGSWSSCSAPKPQCTSGTCCDGCKFRSSGTTCGSSAYKTTYQCFGTCGGRVRRYEQWRTCTGSSASCGTSKLKKVYKGTVKTCGSGQLCTQSGNNASCKTCSTGCVSGKCNSQPKYTICIDPQFGGSAVGASANGVTAKYLNLDIALRLRTLLNKDTSNGAGGGTWNVVMTRTNDTNPSLWSRVNRCNAAGAQRVLSIAVNAYGLKSVRGIESFYYKSSSKNFCSVIHTEVRNRTGFKDRGLKSGTYIMVKNVNAAAACMSAPGFLTSPDDLAKLKSASFRTGIAEAMLYAIQKSFGYGAFKP